MIVNVKEIINNNNILDKRQLKKTNEKNQMTNHASGFQLLVCYKLA